MTPSLYHLLMLLRSDWGEQYFKQHKDMLEKIAFEINAHSQDNHDRKSA